MDIRILTLLLVLIASGLVNGLFYKRRERFRYIINNDLKEPFFHEEINLKIKKEKNLIWYMQKACLKAPDRFTNFTATFKPNIFGGFFIDAINGAYGNWPEEKTFWRIDNATGPLQLGVSKYIPVVNDVIVFNLTTWTGTHP